MEKEKWRHIFNNCLRMEFCAYLESQEKGFLEKFNSKYSTFLKEKYPVSEDMDKAKFFGGDFYISFAYHSLVRVLEFLDKQPEFTTNEFISSLSIDLFETLRSNKVVVATPNDKDLLSKGLEKFIRKIRHALSHSNYNQPNKKAIRIWNIYRRSIDFEVIFQYDAFLNFCRDFGFEVNEELFRRGFFETN